MASLIRFLFVFGAGFILFGLAALAISPGTRRAAPRPLLSGVFFLILAGLLVLGDRLGIFTSA